MQWARVRSPVGTSFLGEVFSGFFLPVTQMSGNFRPPRSPNIIWPSLSSILIHYGRQWPEMLMCPKTQIYIYTAHSPTLPLLHLHHSAFSNPSVTSAMSQLILQPFCHITYITTHSPILPLLHLHHNSFSNPSVTSPTSQLILQSFHCITYVTAHSPTLPLLHLCHSSFSNPFFASPTSQALHLIHLASRPWFSFCI